MKRIFHPWHLWECLPMYETTCKLSDEEAKNSYADFLKDTPRFEAALNRVLIEWPISCEQFLSNESINRIAWLGQASMCIATGVPSCFKGGFKRLSYQDQKTANGIADKWLSIWLRRQSAKKDREIHRFVDDERIPGWHPGRGASGPYEFTTCALLQSDMFRHPEE